MFRHKDKPAWETTWSLDSKPRKAPFISSVFAMERQSSSLQTHDVDISLRLCAAWSQGLNNEYRSIRQPWCLPPFLPSSPPTGRLTVSSLGTRSAACSPVPPLDCDSASVLTSSQAEVGRDKLQIPCNCYLTNYFITFSSLNFSNRLVSFALHRHSQWHGSQRGTLILSYLKYILEPVLWYFNLSTEIDSIHLL